MLQLYAVFDRKMRRYQPTVIGEVNSMAFMRAIADGVRNAKGSLMQMHPEDFDIMLVGELDPESGIITHQGPPRLVENLGTLLASVPEPAPPQPRVLEA